MPYEQHSQSSGRLLPWFEDEMVMRWIEAPEDPEVKDWEERVLRERFLRSVREGDAWRRG